MLATSLPSVSQLSRKCGGLDVSQPYGLHDLLTEIALPIFFKDLHIVFQHPVILVELHVHV
jgi:hypothetical protein